jgi:hypothetical protein
MCFWIAVLGAAWLMAGYFVCGVRRLGVSLSLKAEVKDSTKVKDIAM